MTTKHTYYKWTARLSAVFMIFALLWLTISLPFVYESRQNLSEQTQSSDPAGNPLSQNDDDGTNPLTNSTEEKTPNAGFSWSEEYLHDHDADEHFFFEALLFHKLENTGTYVAYHGEMLVPPPNIA